MLDSTYGSSLSEKKIIDYELANVEKTYGPGWNGVCIAIFIAPEHFFNQNLSCGIAIGKHHRARALP